MHALLQLLLQLPLIPILVYFCPSLPAAPLNYCIIVVLSKSCTSGKNPRDMPLILGCSESVSLVIGGVLGVDRNSLEL